MRMKHLVARIVSTVAAAALLVTSFPDSLTVLAAGGVKAAGQTTGYASTVPTPQDSDLINPNYDRSYDNYSVKSAEGFLHPGIVMNREELNVMRDMVWLGAEPWASDFEKLLDSEFSSLDRKMSYNNYTDLANDTINYAMVADSTAAYELTIMWYITGQQAYADKAMEIIMAWSEGIKKDSAINHIRVGTSTHKFALAAEILRYTPSSGWTEENTTVFKGFLDVVKYSLNKPYEFLNQMGYANMGYMARAIFNDSREEYAQAVERLTYNKENPYKGGFCINGSLSAMILNNGEIVEMGRDQAHGYDDLLVLEYMIRTTYVQGTRVDYDGTIVDVGGQDLFDYGNEKLLKAAAYFAAHNIGYDMKTLETDYPLSAGSAWDGSLAYTGLNGWGLQVGEAGYAFNEFWDQGRGYSVWEPIIYNHYRYIKGHAPSGDRSTVTDTTKDADPYNDKDRTMDLWSYSDLYSLVSSGRGIANIEGDLNIHRDFPCFADMTFTPVSAETTTPSTRKGTPQSYGYGEKTDSSAGSYEDYGRFHGNHFTATGNIPTDIGVGMSNNNAEGGVNTGSGIDEEGNRQYVTDDVKNGEWIAYTVDFDALGSTRENPTDILQLYYASNTSNGAYIQLRIGAYKEKPTADDIRDATAVTPARSYAGAPNAQDFLIGGTGGWDSYAEATVALSASGAGYDESLFTGKKTIYALFTSSDNYYKYNTKWMWFKFLAHSAHDGLQAAGANVITGGDKVADGSVTLTSGGSLNWTNLDFDRGYSSFRATISAEGAGTLKLFEGSAGGTLIDTYVLSGSENGNVTFETDSRTKLLGSHNVCLVYEGNGELTINNLRWEPAAKGADSASDTVFGTDAKDYFGMIRGTARTVSDGLEMDASGTYVTYRGVPYASGAKVMAVRLKSDTDCSLVFDILTSDGTRSSVIGNGNGMASATEGSLVTYELTNTNDEWTTLYISISPDVRANGGGKLMGMCVTGGSGKVTVESFGVDPENSVPTVTLTDAEGNVCDKTIRVPVGTGKLTWHFAVSDADAEDAVAVEVAVPKGMIQTLGEDGTGTLEFTPDTIGTYQVVFTMSDGKATEKVSYTFEVKRADIDENIQAVIDDIENALINYYVYDKQAYDKYAAALAEAIAAPDGTNGDGRTNLEALRAVVEEMLAKPPAYQKIQFEYRNTNAAEAVFTAFVDGESGTGTSGAQIAESESLGKNLRVSKTQWIDLAETVTGKKTITVNLSTSNLRLISFTLSSQDDSMQKNIPAVMATSTGNQNGFSINYISSSWSSNSAPNASDASIPWELRGATSWLAYAISDWDKEELDAYLEALPKSQNNANGPQNNKLQGISSTSDTNVTIHEKSPYYKQPGDGIDFNLVPSVVAAVKNAETCLEEEAKYTEDSFASFKAVYDAAKRAVDSYADYEAGGLTHDKSEALTEALEGAIAALKVNVDESSIADSLINYYVYDKTRYDVYRAAKDAVTSAGENATEAQKAALQSAIEDMAANPPVYRYVQFEYRNTGADGSFTLYKDGTGPSGTKIAQTGLLSGQAKQSTGWIKLEEAVTGAHNLTVDFSSTGLRLLSFTLSSDENGSATKIIPAATYTSTGDVSHFCINVYQDGDTVLGEVRGAASWITYTVSDWDENALHTFVNKTLNPGSTNHMNTGLYYGKPGAGIIFSLVPAVVTAVKTAGEYLEKEQSYTAASFAKLKSAYTAAQRAVEDFENYVQGGLTEEKSNELAEALNNAAAGLILKEDLLTIKADEANPATIADMSGNNDGDLTGPNLSANPAFTANVGETMSFLIQTEGLTNPRVSIQAIGVRGVRGIDTAEALSAIDPVYNLEETGIRLEAQGSDAYKVSWDYFRPGNYRAIIKVECEEGTYTRPVEMIFRNPVVRTDLLPQYLRLRYCAIRDEEKKAEVYLVPVEDGKEGAETLIAVIGEGSEDIDGNAYSFTRTGGTFKLTPWFKIAWPESMPEEFNLKIVYTGRNGNVDFMELATENYAQLYKDAYQAYPLSDVGVLRIEGEHFDYNSLKAYTNLDFSGKNGWEQGNPGRGEGTVYVFGTKADAKTTLKYNGLKLGQASEIPATDITMSVRDGTVMLKGETLEVSAVLTPENATRTKLSYLSSDHSVAAVTGDGGKWIITAVGAGEATITVTNGEVSASVALKVADKNVLRELIEAYEANIAPCEDSYTTASWEELQSAYHTGKEVYDSADATGEAVYTAVADLRTAIKNRVNAADLTVLKAYIALAESFSNVRETEAGGADSQDTAAVGQDTENKENAGDGDGADRSEPGEAESVAGSGEYTADKDSADENSESGDMAGNKKTAESESDAAANEEPGEAEKGVTEGDESESGTGITELAETAGDSGSNGNISAYKVEVTTSVYTEESWNTLQSALEAARLMTKDDTQEEVNEAAAKLQQAIWGLTETESIPADEELMGQLKQLVARAQEIVNTEEGNYTEITWKDLKEVLAHAGALLESAEQLTVADVDVAVKLLEAAIGNLAVDKSELGSYYAEVSGKKEEEYTSSTWKPFAEALTKAREILEKEAAAQKEVNEALAALKAAAEALEAKAKTGALEAAVQEAKALDESKYTEDSFAAVKEALEKAQEVLADETASQSQVDAAEAALTAAVQALKEKEEQTEPADTKALEAAVEEAKALDESKYTEESFAAVKEALKKAEEVLADEKAGQSQVDAAKDALQEAVEALEEKEPAESEKPAESDKPAERERTA